MGFDLSEFQFDAEKRRQLGYKLVDRINQYFSSLEDRAVQLPLEKRTFGELHDHMPEIGENAEAVLDEICRELIEKGFHVPSANYFGLMNPTPTYMAVLAEMLVAALNPQLATLARSQLASKIENETVRWIGERVGWNRAFDGTFTSGGNEANFSALALALAAHFPQTVEDGIASIGAQPVFYASTESHHSLDKSAGLLGLGRKAMRRVPVNDQVQMDVKKLEATIQEDTRAGHKPFCVVATAGTTNSGAIDDMVAIAEVCRRHSLWLHVDGAYGAAAIFSDRHRALVKGIELADSVTFDPHKWLAMPFAAGVILTSRPELLQRAFGVSTPYMPKITGAPLIDNFKVSVQWSRRMNSLKLWLTLRVHGRQAYEQLIDRQLQLARDFAAWVKQSENYELAAPLQLPILNLRVKGKTEVEVAAANASVVDEVTRDGKRWISLTTVNGRSVIRVMIISYLTTEKNMQELQHALDTAAKRFTVTATGTVLSQ
ncbi:MAG TPA: aminotransferase class I/II-fold pyridoxal phosphate-dependent enzyme [Terriglobales bacterium]|nr:aminotransferase class I/II-fold pyridoxal phosphate-dependent enzyme [Terriglobales bacterium]